jgi:hypothetical protein
MGLGAAAILEDAGRSESVQEQNAVGACGNRKGKEKKRGVLELLWTAYDDKFDEAVPNLDDSRLRERQTVGDAQETRREDLQA